MRAFLLGSILLCAMASAVEKPTDVKKPAEIYGPHDLVNPDEAKALYSKFEAACDQKLKAFLHRAELQRKQLASVIERRRKEFAQTEEARRVDYFRGQISAQQKEFYVSDLKKRTADFDKGLTDESLLYESDIRKRQKRLTDNLSWRKQEAKKLLEDGSRPPQALWPR